MVRSARKGRRHRSGGDRLKPDPECQAEITSTALAGATTARSVDRELARRPGAVGTFERFVHQRGLVRKDPPAGRPAGRDWHPGVSTPGGRRSLTGARAGASAHGSLSLCSPVAGCSIDALSVRRPWGCSARPAYLTRVQRRERAVCLPGARGRVAAFRSFGAPPSLGVVPHATLAAIRGRRGAHLTTVRPPGGRNSVSSWPEEPRRDARAREPWSPGPRCPEPCRCLHVVVVEPFGRSWVAPPPCGTTS
jgi:hypothetical protein